MSKTFKSYFPRQVYYHNPMNLITVLIALGVEFRLGNFDRYRNLSWFVRYSDWLGDRLAGVRFWHGPGGVLLTLFLPLAALGLLVYLAGEALLLLGFLLSFVALVYSFGPALGELVDAFVAALDNEDEAACKEILAKLRCGDPEEEGADQARVLASIMLRAHEYLFAVIFWFLLLGAVGALLYCLTLNLAQRHDKAENSYAGAVKDLHNILMWPSARLLALGFALGGSLVSALESWRSVSGHTLDISSDVITGAGFGALHYKPAEAAEAEDDKDKAKTSFINRLKETMALINRTLIVWLIALGLMTITGWIG